MLINIAQKFMNFIWTPHRLYWALTLLYIVPEAILIFYGGQLSMFGALCLCGTNVLAALKIQAFIDAKFPSADEDTEQK